MATPKATPSPRRYGGNSADERKEARRARILEAAITVYGRHGYRGSTVQAVCDEAGLTKRYFYESYRDSAQLLAAGLRSVVTELVEELAQAAPKGAVALEDRARLILRAYFESLKADAPRARLFLLEADGIGPEVADAMREAQGKVADLLVPSQPGSAEDARASLQRLGAVAGVARISSIWIGEDYSLAVDDVVESAMSLFAGLLRTMALDTRSDS
jgi:AcrR family transcriptional regulator